MSDGAVREVTMQSEEQAQTQTSAGAILRQAREAARMQLPTMAAMLKVPQHKLEALEADQYEAFPDHVFMRALAMGMCRNLHIDAEPVLALLPRTALKSLGSAGGGINETVKERSHFKSSGPSFDSRDGSSRKIIAGVLLLLAAAAAVYFVPFHQASDSSADDSSQVTEAPAVAQAPASGVVVETGSVVIPSETSAEAVAPLPSASAVNEAAGTAAASAAATPAAPVVAAETAATAVAAPAADAGSASVVEFKASAQSWVKVKDASGKVVLEKTLTKDQSVTAEGKLPLSVIVGNAKGTQVLVRGQPFDISTTRDNVARFEVK
ncbi:helix-turn-helix domain-containing protein [Comamonas sp. Y6]|uniref:Helix-turn-helix domain-containing protein n=2 Tax=Comamonas resistens TaxID=3046670 RepID=A0ABY8SLS9_9BURK|nr:helix-turn-helix domain-containing protein [Comamonas resistens]MDL5038542.1 helix-turn-helix domain-containing protein [Comamonas resistens]WHS64030.1 helix-turn-helix domain-containing protein [Comamonas resistens]